MKLAITQPLLRNPGFRLWGVSYITFQLFHFHTDFSKRVVRDSKAIFLMHRAFVPLVLKSPKREMLLNPIKRSVYFRKYDVLNSSKQDDHIIKIKSHCFGGDNSWRWSRFCLLIQGTTLGIIFEIKEVKLSWPKTSREWKNFESNFYDSYCCKRNYVNTGNLKPNKILWKGKFHGKDFSWISSDFISYRNHHPRGHSNHKRIDHSASQKWTGSSSLPLLKKFVLSKDIKLRDKWN